MSKIIIINTVLSRKVTNGETVFKNSLLLAFDRALKSILHQQRKLMVS